MKWIVWHDTYGSRGMVRSPLGTVEAPDYHAALFVALRKFGNRKWEPAEGRQNITVTPSETELVCVRDFASMV